jgi:hypothetical protein
MRLKKLFATVPAIALAAGLGACDNGLTDLNSNPNAPEEVPPANLLANAIVRSAGSAYGSHGVWYGLYLTNIWSQQAAQVKYNDEDRYTPRPDQLSGVWNHFYAGPLRDLAQVKEYAKEAGAGADNLEAVAEILSQMNFQYLTDTYGDVPYSEALLLDSGVASPKYDAQKDIYYGMLARLTAAAAALEPGENTGGWASGDVLYDGDVAHWRKFANSLRMRMAMRMSEVDPAKARAEFAAAYAAGGFTSNADNAVIRWSGEQPSQNPLYDYYYNQDRYDFVISEAMVDSMASLNDPRLPIYADVAKDDTYRGLKNGSLPADFGKNVPDYSSIGAYFLEADAPSVLQSYAEVLFLQAEAAARGWIAGDAQALYRAGVRASLEQYGIASSTAQAYAASLPYNGLPSIAFQKWLALYMNGPEGWAEVRRTGYPMLTPARGAQLPTRLIYPNEEQIVNSANWQSAVTASGGGTSVFDKVWWDK